MMMMAQRAPAANRRAVLTTRRAARTPAARALGVGDKAPAFSAKDQNGKTVTLSGLQLPLIGKSVVLAFYPADATPGCTKVRRAHHPTRWRPRVVPHLPTRGTHAGSWRRTPEPIPRR